MPDRRRETNHADAAPITRGNENFFVDDKRALTQQGLFIKRRGPPGFSRPEVDVVQACSANGAGGKGQCAITCDGNVAAEGQTVTHPPDNLPGSDVKG
jgi:hypothetical protein